jgi:hypothetical protein
MVSLVNRLKNISHFSMDCDLFAIKYTHGYLFLSYLKVFFFHQPDVQHHLDDEIQRFRTESTWLKGQRHDAMCFGV